ncbi:MULTISPECIES: sensor histidine kinase [unclassified Microbacterium]|uniref:sensor histidine kinase n=1 Tax=unclassified Microbacterium TaxID=2609290 RepID=UPI00341E534B
MTIGPTTPPLTTRARDAAGRVVMIVVGALLDVCAVANVPGAAVFSATGSATDGRVSVTGLGTGLAFLAILCWLTVLWIDRVPMLATIAGVALAVLGVSYVLLLVGAVGLARRHPARLRAVAIVASSLVALFALREIFTPWGSALPYFLAADPSAHDGPGWVVASLASAVLSLSVAAAVVFVGRARERVDRSERQAAAASERVESLREETVRQAERERIARDMHDALAHRLSVVSLHAGALESAAGDGAATDIARTVREQTHAALQDMRGLIGDLRSTPLETSRTPATMRAIGALLASIRSAGQPVSSMVLIESVERAGALLDGAVYRIVQEALTNAVKHAGGAPVDVFVRVAPTDGARIRVVNPIVAGALTVVPGGGNGVLGIRERAAALGGEAWIGPHAGEFVVDVSMPWQEAG